ncbi:Methyl-accepting chemotaxis protein III [compost metagenome]
METGSEQVTQAGQAMDEIVSSVRRVSDLIGEITASSSEQRDGIAQVNVAVTQLDQMTQQNAALVEESAAAASSLRDQAQRLAEVVSVFNVGYQPAAAPAPRPAAARAPAPRPAAAPAGKVTASTGAPRKLQTPKPAPAATRAPAPAKAPAAAPTRTKGSDDDWEAF